MNRELERNPDGSMKPFEEAMDEWRDLIDKFETAFPKWQVISFNPGFLVTKRGALASRSFNMSVEFLQDLIPMVCYE